MHYRIVVTSRCTRDLIEMFSSRSVRTLTTIFKVFIDTHTHTQRERERERVREMECCEKTSHVKGEVERIDSIETRERERERERETPSMILEN